MYVNMIGVEFRQMTAILLSYLQGSVSKQILD